jgi:YbbR domain-containing protein
MTFLPVPAFLRRNLGQKFLSLVLAVALWWYVAGESRVQVGQVVPLEIRNLPVGTVITNKVERQVELRLSAPPTLLSTLKPTEMGVSVDLASLGEGKHAIPLSERDVTIPRGVKVERIFPPVVEVQLAKVLRRSVPVVAVVHLPASGGRRPYRVEVTPPEAVVEATEEEFARIRSVETEEIRPDRKSGPWTGEAPLNPPGGHAKILEPRTVRVRLTFRGGESR